MTVTDRKAGAASVDPDDFNAVVDAVATLQANQGGGSQTLCIEFTVDAGTFPAGQELVPTGIMLEVGDRIVDVGVSVSEDLDPTNDFAFGKYPISGAANKLSGDQLQADSTNDGGPYSGATGSGVLFDIAGANAYGGQGRLPCIVLEAHELYITATDPITTGSCVVSVYLIRAGSVDEAEIVASPAITSLTPDTGPVGTPVVIAGSGFTGATSLTIGSVNTAMVFTVDWDSQISTHIPVGVPEEAGYIKVTVGGAVSGEGSDASFTVTS